MKRTTKTPPEGFSRSATPEELEAAKVYYLDLVTTITKGQHAIYFVTDRVTGELCPVLCQEDPRRGARPVAILKSSKKLHEDFLPPTHRAAFTDEALIEATLGGLRADDLGISEPENPEGGEDPA